MDKKPFNILVIRNCAEEYDFSDDLLKFQDWMRLKTPFEPVFDRMDTALTGLKHKPFKVDADGKTWFGLDGIKDRLRKEANIPLYTYKVVIFLYDFKETEYPKGEGFTRAGGWTYPNELNGSVFMEVPALDNLDAIDDFYRVLTHEIIHAFHRICWNAGVPTQDTMDFYDHEWEITAPDGNRERNLAVLAPHWELIGRTPAVRAAIAWLVQMFPKLRPFVEKIERDRKLELEKPRRRIEEWSNAIQEYEGYFVGSRSFRNCNPGNLKESPYARSKDPQGFCVFANFAEGMKALVYQLTIAADGRSKAYTPTDTLVDFFRKWAPVADRNDPQAYAEYVAKRLGVTPLAQIGSFL